MVFSKQEYWTGQPFPSPGHLPDPGIKLASLALAGRLFTTESPGKPRNVCKCYQMIPVRPYCPPHAPLRITNPYINACSSCRFLHFQETKVQIYHDIQVSWNPTSFYFSLFITFISSISFLSSPSSQVEYLDIPRTHHVFCCAKNLPVFQDSSLLSSFSWFFS